MNVVERAAKAILEIHPSWSWEKANEATKEHYRRKARAAILALREPTEAMVIAGCRHENMGDMAGRWRAMIDEAVR